MDKQKLIGSLAQTPEDELLLARVLDRLSAGERKNIPASTCFLTGREQELCKLLVKRAMIQEVYFFGGTPGAERQVACYVPEYFSADEYFTSEDGPICALRAEISAFDSLDHRDFLGGILGQGIKREVLGDIFVSGDHCDFLVTKEIAPYLLEHLTQVGRAKITLKEIPLSVIDVPQQKTKTIRDTVASLRLDGIMSSGFQIGRGKAQDLISGGKTEVNHMPVLKSDRLIAQGDVISCRGLGKLVVTEIQGQTKKGRTVVVLDRFL